VPNPVAERSKARVWGRSLAGIAVSNPAGCMGVCLLWVLCVVRQKYRQGADPSSRGAVPTATLKLHFTVVHKIFDWTSGLKQDAQEFTHKPSTRSKILYNIRPEPFAFRDTRYRQMGYYTFQQCCHDEWVRCYVHSETQNVRQDSAVMEESRNTHTMNNARCS
jgi:hypothetical protein